MYIYFVTFNLYEDVDEGLMCKNRAKHFNKSVILIPEHITENIIMVAGCEKCEKVLEMIELLDGI